jgi:hypothetical protein
MDARELKRKREILEALKQRKHTRDLQAAQFGVLADPVITTERQELAEQIERLEQELAEAERQSERPQQVDAGEDRRGQPQHNPEKPRPAGSTAAVGQGTPRTRSGLLLGGTVVALIIVGVGALFFLRNLPVAPRGATPQASPSPATSRTTLRSGDTWKKADRELTLTRYTFAGNKVTLWWKFANNARNDVTVASSTIRALGGTSSGAARPKLSLTCSGFDCAKDVVLRPGDSIEYSHVMEFPSADLPRALTVVTGFTGEVQWEIVR